MNLDPPVVYVRSDSQLSDALRAYLDEHARVEYTYDIGDDGFRVTVPAVKAGRKILMAGDSGVFGVGVDDEDTIASRLQGIVGGAAQVVNAGVGGYDGDQAFLAARDASDAVAYDQLVYVAHHNDFYEPRDIANPDRARQVLARFESIRDRFPGGVVVALLTYLEFNAEDVLGSQGWTPDRLEAARRLRGELPIIARKAGFGFVDFSDVVDAVRARERTIFAPWSLYVDHAHLSPRAAGLFAAEIEAALAGEAENASARQRR